jgi:hypothetical protein
MSSASSSIETPAFTRRTLPWLRISLLKGISRQALRVIFWMAVQDVEPRIAAAGGGVRRHGEWRLRRRRPPGLYQRDAAGFQLTDDLVGDFRIEARPVLTGTGASGVYGHRGSPRRAPRASLATFNPSRPTRPDSHSLQAAAPGGPCRGSGLCPPASWVHDCGGRAAFMPPSATTRCVLPASRSRALATDRRGMLPARRSTPDPCR